MEKLRDRTVLKYILWVTLAVLAIRYFDYGLLVASILWSAAQPLLMGVALAYVLNIAMTRLERLYFPHTKTALVRRSRRPVCLLFAIVLILTVFTLVVVLVLPELLGALAVVVRAIPTYFDQLTAWLLNNANRYPEIEESLRSLNIDWNTLFKNMGSVAMSGVGGLFSASVSIVGSLTGGVINLFVILVFALFLLAGKERLIGQMQRLARVYLKPATVARILRVSHTANLTFSSFITGQCTEAVILGLLCTLGMLILGFPYAPMVGAFIGVTALIPIVGAYVGGGVGAFMIFTVNPLQALLFVLFLVVLQQLEGNLIYPKVVGTSIGLPGIWVMVAVTLGGGLAGIPGMLFGVPTAATLYKLLKTDVLARQQPQKMP